ncbi:uncharacterized protein LOC135215145 [Macrobrachium nipponense]|uniref:uncharacterized protein LOC135215145 n=1 Tax=Macrobrachium nipponense TaxID=159736 RepID=UPI0030C7E2B5
MVLLILTLKNSKIILRNSEGVTNEIQSMGRSTRDTSDHVQEFYQKLKLFVLSVFSITVLDWAASILSEKFPPSELWAPIEILSALQGLFVFIILLTSQSKRRLIEERFLSPFRFARRCLGTICKAKREPAVEDQTATPSVAESSTSDSTSNRTASSVLELSPVSSGRSTSECYEASERV